MVALRLLLHLPFPFFLSLDVADGAKESGGAPFFEIDKRVDVHPYIAVAITAAQAQLCRQAAFMHRAVFACRLVKNLHEPVEKAHVIPVDQSADPERAGGIVHDFIRQCVNASCAWIIELHNVRCEIPMEI